VVASEVRSLAQRSSQAAKDIAHLITNSSSSQVKEGVGLVNQAGAALNEIVESICAVAGIVSGIATASAEQAIGIDEINKALTQMDEATQRNSALVEENAATAKTLEQQAKSMDEQVAFFQVDAVQAVNREPVQAGRAAPRRQAADRAASMPDVTAA
jgi:methyl-accepting chemotaxis protein